MSDIWAYASSFGSRHCGETKHNRDMAGASGGMGGTGMSDGSKIPWCDATVNAWRGCTRCSPGCENCYAVRVCRRLEACHKGDERFAGLVENGDWTGDLKLDRKAGRDIPKNSRRVVFVNSLSDFHHENAPDAWRMDVIRYFSQRPLCTFIILTKRADRMLAFWRRWADSLDNGGRPIMARGPDAVRKAHTCVRALMFADMIEGWGKPPDGAAYPIYDWLEGMGTWPNVLPNVYLGVTVCNQQEADAKLPALAELAAAGWKTFVSVEPMLGAVDLGLGRWVRLARDASNLKDLDDSGAPLALKAIMGRVASAGVYLAHANRCGALSVPSTKGDLFGIKPGEFERLAFPLGVIVGGESGPGARPMHPDWVRAVRDQCTAAGVPFYFKQWGSYIRGGYFTGANGLPLLDGVEHAALPWWEARP